MVPAAELMAEARCVARVLEVSPCPQLTAEVLYTAGGVTELSVTVAVTVPAS
jgi:hypothetical protein